MSTDTPPGHTEGAVQITSSFEALADSRRQFVLSYLHQRSGMVSIDKLAERMAQETEESLLTTRLLLYHTHVPKLADTGLILYDAEQRTVGRTATTGRTVSLLDRARSAEW